MKRDMMTIANQIKINPKYDLFYSEIVKLMNIEDKFDVISIAFNYGYAMGSRAEKKKDNHRW